MYIRLFCICLILAGCDRSRTASPIDGAAGEAEQSPGLSAQDALDRGIIAHGGLAVWRSFGTLEYEVDKGARQERHLIDLQTRKALHTGDTYQFGYDGTDVWITPGLDAYSGSPRFSNGLDFYFFAIPFVLADPGTHREPLGRVMADGAAYDAVKISFDDGVGDSPDDYYIVHFDPETHRLRLLLYTATFRSREPSENYNARVYEEWQEVDGLMVPKKIVSYRWEGEQRRLGEKRGETWYNDVQFSSERPDPKLFARPEGADIDAPPPG